MGKIVAKFGGSSLADAKQFRQVKHIISLDDRRCYVVPSAPGKRFSGDDKVTDLLYAAHRFVNEGGTGENVALTKIRERYNSIRTELGLHTDIDRELDAIEAKLSSGISRDEIASRGEYLNGLLLAEYLGYAFLDPKDFIFFNEKGIFQGEKTNDCLSAILQKMPNAVVPGFYGSLPDGSIHTFSRGGSDITGAIVARAANAELYENWTDVDGFLMADPRVVKDPQLIEHITYRELRELSYMGATVLHEDSVFPVHAAGIPTNIRNTGRPEAPGTMISFGFPGEKQKYTITGVAGHVGFSVLSVEKDMMNAEVGFGRKVLQAVEECGLSFEHLPTGIDTMCVVILTKALGPVKDQLIRRIVELVEPDVITVNDNIGIIATVGRGMVHNPGTAARLFSALSRAHVNVEMIDQGSSELSILVGIRSTDYDRAVNAIYDEFVRGEQPREDNP